MRPFAADALMQVLKRALASRAILSGFADDSLYDDDMLRADRIDIRDFEKLRKVLKNAKIDDVPNGKFTVNKHGLTEEEREKAERAKKKPARELSAEEKELLRRLREEREAKRNFKATLRAISVRMPLMLYGADGNWDEDISLDRFVELVDEASWAEFMPKGVTKKLFEKFKKYYDKDVFALSAKSIRRQAQGADALFPEERIQILAEVFGRFRNPDKETVLTPWKVVNRQLSDTLGGYVFFDEDFKSEISVPRFVNHGDATAATFVNTNAKILEINSKTGLYPLYVVYSLYRARLGGRTPTTVEEANEVWDAVCRENMFVLTLTPMAKSITHRTLVGYRNASTRIKVMPNLVKRLKDNTPKVAAEIKKGSMWGSQGSFAFDAVVGNPPYQEDDGGFASSASPVYNVFVDAAIALRPRFVSLITPSRWFVGGKGLDDFRSRLLADHHLSLLVDFPLLYEPFSNVKIRGGISYFLWDSGYNGPCTVTTMEGGKAVGKSDTRFLDEFDVLVRRNEAVPILRKVLARKETTIECGISSSKPFGLRTFFKGADSATGITDAIKLYGNQKITWIDRSAVTTNAKWIDEWKVLMTAVQGTSSAVETRFLSNPIVAGPGTACTETYIVAGHFRAESQADNLANYLRTRFVRFLISLRKATQHATRDVYAFVPIQDFTSSSDIDWSRPVSEIDNQLYAKYGVTKSEQKFIESMIKPME